MNSFESLEDIHLPFIDSDNEDAPERKAHYLRQLRLLQDINNRSQKQALREDKRRKMADASSDSEVDAVTKGVKEVTVTPAGSTPPQELVKLDP
jgi:hypothetical protein